MSAEVSRNKPLSSGEQFFQSLKDIKTEELKTRIEQASKYIAEWNEREPKIITLISTRLIFLAKGDQDTINLIKKTFNLEESSNATSLSTWEKRSSMVAMMKEIKQTIVKTDGQEDVDPDVSDGEEEESPASNSSGNSSPSTTSSSSGSDDDDPFAGIKDFEDEQT